MSVATRFKPNHTNISEPIEKTLKAYSLLPISVAAVVLKSTSQILAQDTAVTIAWDPPQRHENIADYKVHYGKSSRNYETNFSVGTATQATLQSLKPASVYYVAATAEGPGGHRSEYSDELVVVTNRSFNANSNSSGTITVSWDGNTESLTKTATRVYFRNYPAAETNYLDVSPEHNKVTISGLYPAELYHIATSQIDPASGAESRIRDAKTIITNWSGSGTDGLRIDQSSASITSEVLKLQAPAVADKLKVEISQSQGNNITLQVTAAPGAKVILQHSPTLEGFYNFYTLQMPASGKQVFLMPKTGPTGFFRAISENK